MKIKAIKNWAWACRVQQFNNQTAETKTLMQRAFEKVGAVDLVVTLLGHIKRQNEKIKNLQAQVKILNELTLRRSRGNRDFRKFHQHFVNSVREDYLAVSRERWYKQHPEREGTLMTDAEAADLIIAANAAVKQLTWLAWQKTNIPF